MAKWWKTWQFMLGVIAAIVILGYIGYRLRISAIRRRQKYLELITLHQQKLIDSEIRTQERERKRIATDLHDGIGASLSSIKIQVADVANDAADNHETRVKEINEHLTDVIDDIKRIVYDLHPPGLERYGLQAGLKSLVDRLNKTSDINVIFDYYGQRDVVQTDLDHHIPDHTGIDQQYIKTCPGIRDPRYTSTNSTTRSISCTKNNGIGMIGSRFTGLGLHSIESRVRSLNGRMSWESNHKGTFYISIFLFDTFEKYPQSSIMIKVLLVDDHLMFLDGLELLLKRTDSYEVVGKINDPLHVIDFLTTTPVDIVLADIQMPGVDGIDLLKKDHIAVPED